MISTFLALAAKALCPNLFSFAPMLAMAFNLNSIRQREHFKAMGWPFRPDQIADADEAEAAKLADAKREREESLDPEHQERNAWSDKQNLTVYEATRANGQKLIDQEKANGRVYAEGDEQKILEKYVKDECAAQGIPIPQPRDSETGQFKKK